MPEKQTIQETNLFKLLKEKDNPEIYAAHVIEFFNICAPLLTNVKNLLPNFTDHSITHSLRVADYIFDLLPGSPAKYNNLEIMIMLYIAIGHDLGMAIYEKTTERTKEIQNQIRLEHHLNIETLFSTNSSFREDLFIIGDFNLKRNIIDICRSHGESINWIKDNLKKDETYGYETIHPQFLAFLLRLADLIDFDNRRTPQVLYDLYLNDLPRISKNEWNKQLSITNYEKIKVVNNQKTIYFNGSFSDFNTGLGIYNYLQLIESEIDNIQTIQSYSEDEYTLYINSKVENNLTMNNFNVQPLKKYMDYKKISKLLMGEHLYKNKKIALRELLQNAIDACKVKKEIKGESYNPIITITIDNDFVHIIDNGIGMSLNEVEKYFLSVGNSFYTSSDYSFSYKPISNYGIGFLSSFMLSKELLIKTISYKSQNTSYTIFLSKDEEYVFLGNEPNYSADSGTDIRLSKKDFFHVFFNTDEIKKFIETNLLISDIRILIIQDNNTIECNTKQKLNTLDLSKYLKNVDCHIDYDISSFFTISKKQNFTHDLYQTFIYAPNYYDGIMDEEIYNELYENGNFDFFRLLNDEGDIGILEIFELTSEQEEILDDLNYEVDEEDFIDKFPELFSNYSEKHTIYVDADEIENMSEYYIQNHILVDNKREILSSLSEEELFTFVANQFGNGRRFRLTYGTKKFFITETLFTDIQDDIEIDCSNSFFVKGIKLSTAKIQLPIMFEKIKFKSVFVNIKDQCIPDLRRETISDEDMYEIGYAIAKAFLMKILDTKLLEEYTSRTPKKCTFDEDELNFIRKIIDRYYSYPGKFLI